VRQMLGGLPPEDGECHGLVRGPCEGSRKVYSSMVPAMTRLLQVDPRAHP
jgi:hypothetical protein